MFKSRATKIISILAISCLFLIIAPLQAQDSITLRILHNWGPEDSKGPAMQAVFDGFMELYPNVTIETEVLPDPDIPTRVETAFLGGEEPDLIFQNYLGESLEWVDAGVTIPVTDLIDEWGFEGQFLDAALSQYTRADGEVAAFPLEGFNWPIWYNTAIFEEAGVEIPTTIEELLAASVAIREAGYQPFAVGGSDWTGYRFSQLLLVSGLPQDEAIELLTNGGFSENEHALAAMEAFVQMRDGGVFADNVEGLDFALQNELFFTGQAAMMHGGAWSYADLPEELQDSVVLGGFPLIADSPYDMPTAWAGFTAKGVHITRNGAEHMDVVRDFIQFLYQPENIARFVEDAGMVPPMNVEVNESQLNPLFLRSLSLPETATYVYLAELSIPAVVNPDWVAFAGDIYIPNDLSATDILAGIDEIYADTLE
ncbi:MAG: extracellular solute-binding protein [Aggregatilineales bacterium]